MKHTTHLEDIKHLRWLGEYESYHSTHAYHWRKSLDVDTFFSIAFSIQAARHGIDMIAGEVDTACPIFGDDLREFATQLTSSDRIRNSMPFLIAA